MVLSVTPGLMTITLEEVSFSTMVPNKFMDYHVKQATAVGELNARFLRLISTIFLLLLAGKWPIS